MIIKQNDITSNTVPETMLKLYENKELVDYLKLHNARLGECIEAIAIAIIYSDGNVYVRKIID